VTLLATLVPSSLLSPQLVSEVGPLCPEVDLGLRKGLSDPHFSPYSGIGRRSSSLSQVAQCRYSLKGDDHSCWWGKPGGRYPDTLAVVFNQPVHLRPSLEESRGVTASASEHSKLRDIYPNSGFPDIFVPPLQLCLSIVGKEGGAMLVEGRVVLMGQWGAEATTAPHRFLWIINFWVISSAPACMSLLPHLSVEQIFLSKAHLP
jgi:hypothetical protein